MTRAPHRPGSGLWVRSLAWLGLVAYLGGMGWFMTLCTAALAVVDGEHSVRIESRPQGFFVILGHDRLSQRPGPSHSHHSHDWIADLLTSMASESLTAGGDHVIDLDRDPGLAARSGEASIRGPGLRNPATSESSPAPLPSVAPSRRPYRQAPIAVRSALSPSLRVGRTHVIRC